MNNLNEEEKENKIECDECGEMFFHPEIPRPFQRGFYGEFTVNGEEFTIALCGNCNTEENIRKIVEKLEDKLS